MINWEAFNQVETYYGRVMIIIPDGYVDVVMQAMKELCDNLGVGIMSNSVVRNQMVGGDCGATFQVMAKNQEKCQMFLDTYEHWVQDAIRERREELSGQVPPNGYISPAP